MTTIHVYGAKGGVGTSTVAALIALELQDQGRSVQLESAGGDVGDLRAVLGRPPGLAFGQEGEPITFVGESGWFDFDRVIDHGTTPPVGPDPGDTVYMVIRPCYLALRRALALPCRPTGIILLSESERPLGQRDIEDVLGVRVVASIPVDASTARAIDAGLLSARRRRLRLHLPLAA